MTLLYFRSVHSVQVILFRGRIPPSTQPNYFLFRGRIPPPNYLLFRGRIPPPTPGLENGNNKHPHHENGNKIIRLEMVSSSPSHWLIRQPIGCRYSCHVICLTDRICNCLVYAGLLIKEVAKFS